MGFVKATVEIAASPQKVWEVLMDPHRLVDWVTIHKTLNAADSGSIQKGFQIDQTLSMAGISIRVLWELAEFTPYEFAHWNGTGPHREQGAIIYELIALANGKTKFTYENHYELPGKSLGAFASRIVGDRVAKYEAEKSLGKLKTLLEK